MRKIPFINAIGFLILFTMLVGCSGETSPNSSGDTEVVTLESYETIVSLEDNILATPKILRHDGDSSLFVYDAGLAKIVELDANGEVRNTFGKRGRGPGEFQMVNNMFVDGSHIYIYDYLGYFINKFRTDGELISTLNIGALSGISNSGGSAMPFAPSTLRREDTHNQPYVTSEGNVLLTPERSEEDNQSLYQLRDWQSHKIAGIGEVPPGSAFIYDPEDYKTAIENQNIPPIHKPRVFPVQDSAHPDEFFLIYSALGKIGKYDTTGNKLWEREIPSTPEIDTVKTKFFETSREMLADGGNKITLGLYYGGASGPDGNLFLVAAKSGYFAHLSNPPLWVHQFNNEGKLIRRYKLLSDDVDLYPIFEVDVQGRQIFVVTEETEIRAYSF